MVENFGVGHAVEKLKPEVKAEWVRRLRSGLIKQVRGTLNLRGTGQCCLGVLCDVHRDLTGTGEWITAETLDGAPSKAQIYIANKEGSGSASIPPREVILWAGLTGQNNQAINVPLPTQFTFSVPAERKGVITLANLNDGGTVVEDKAGIRSERFDAWTFEQIADYIEEHL